MNSLKKITVAFVLLLISVFAFANVIQPDGSLEYILADGDDYIDTGIPARTGVKIEAVVEWTNVSGDYAFFAARVGADRFYPIYIYNSCLGIGVNGEFKYLNQNDITNLNANHTDDGNVKVEAGRKYKVISDFADELQTISIDGKTVYSGTHATGMDLGINLFLFAMNYSSNNYPSKAKLYSAKIWLDGELVREYVPHIEDGYSGLYDKINGTFSMPIGTGRTFGVSPRKLPGKPDAFVDWIGSGNDTIMDLGITARTGTTIEGSMEWTYIDGGQESTFIGAKGSPNYLVPMHEFDGNMWIAHGTTKVYLTDENGNSRKFDVNKRYDFRFVADENEASFTLNGEKLYEITNPDVFDSNETLKLFALGNRYCASYSKCYKLKIWQDGVLIGDYYPAVKDGKTCLYNSVTDECCFPWVDLAGKYAGKPVVEMGSSVYKQPKYPKYRVEYLTSDSVKNNTSFPPQYIDIGINGKSGIKVEAEVEWLNTSADNGLIGSKGDGDNRIYAIHTYVNTLCCGYDKFIRSNAGLSTNRVYDVVSILNVGEQKMFLDGVEVYSATNTKELDNGYSMYIFCENVTGQPRYFSNARIYSMKIWENDVLIRNLIPVIADNMEVCFYDKVNNTFYGSEVSSGFWSYGNILGAVYNGSTIIIR